MSEDILLAIEAATRDRVRHEMELCPHDELRGLCSDPQAGMRAYGAARGFALRERTTGCFEAALRAPGLSFVCEVKQASPSKGLIDPVFDYLSIARDYEAGGASCMSCLTEPRWFKGNDGIFMELRQETGLPMIRKDFIVGSGADGDGLDLGEYQIRQSCLMGADCILLICSLLDENTLMLYLALAGELGLDALVEAHDASEVEMASRCGARIIGVNNRNLRDFSVDFDNARRMRERIPEDCVYVAESGVGSLDDIAMLAASGADAVLVGEFLMRARDKVALLGEMRKAADAL